MLIANMIKSVGADEYLFALLLKGGLDGVVKFANQGVSWHFPGIGTQSFWIGLEWNTIEWKTKFACKYSKVRWFT